MENNPVMFQNVPNHQPEIDKPPLDWQSNWFTPI
jgi:hypothetical protein